MKRGLWITSLRFGLLTKYNLEQNKWLSNLYELRGHWAAVFRDSFSADMTSTQRSEGMINVFKKIFRRKLCLSELIEECEKCAASLQENELDADYFEDVTDTLTQLFISHIYQC
jgi:zinc finger SWIM domain-containing protein 3